MLALEVHTNYGRSFGINLQLPLFWQYCLFDEIHSNLTDSENLVSFTGLVIKAANM